MNASINIEWLQGIRGYAIHLKATRNTLEEAKEFTEQLRIGVDKGARLKELLTIKRNAEIILNDDTVNSWGNSSVKPKYSITEVKVAHEAFSNAVKETDEIINKL